MLKKWKVLLSAGMLTLSVVMILLFPREKSIAIATVFAILFWLSLIACVWLAAITIRKNLVKKRK